MHIIHKECVDRGKLTLEKLRKDTVEPSSITVQGVHRKKSVLSSERERVTKNSVGLFQAGIK